MTGEKHFVGMVVYTTSKNYTPGHYAKSWKAYYFETFEGTIRLEND